MSRLRLSDMADDIANTIHHGECLYSDEGLAELFVMLDEFKSACIENLAEIKAEREAELHE